MNIFILDWQHEQCAKWHCDKHIVKMPLETTQMLCTTHWRYDSPAPYKPVHQKHPCTLWVGTTVDNYKWTVALGLALCKEYTYRYEREHACEQVIRQMCEPPKVLTNSGLTTPYQAMPHEYKHYDCTVAYKNYYIGEKAGFCKWKKRTIPPFMQQAMLYN